MSNAYFSGLGSDGPNVSAFSSLVQSLQSGGASTPSTASATMTSANPSSSSPSNVAAQTTATSDGGSITAASISPTTFSTATSSTATPSSSTPNTNSASNASSSPSPVQAPAYTSSTSANSATECHGLACSAGLRAAVAVPIVVVVLAVVGIIVFCCMRRRRRRNNQQEPELREKGFTGGFKNTGFTQEHERRGLVVKQLSQSTNKSSRGSGGVVVEPAQPRETSRGASIISSQQPTVAQAPRPTNGPTPAGFEPQTAIPVAAERSRFSTQPEIRDPFSDSAEQSPVDHSPFDDPPNLFRSRVLPSYQIQQGPRLSTPEVRRATSHDSIVHDSGQSIGSSVADAEQQSDAGSIREAQIGRRVSVNAGHTVDAQPSRRQSIQEARVGRHISVASGGRTIEDVQRDI